MPDPEKPVISDAEIALARDAAGGGAWDDLMPDDAWRKALVAFLTARVPDECDFTPDGSLTAGYFTGFGACRDAVLRGKI